MPNVLLFVIIGLTFMGQKDEGSIEKARAELQGTWRGVKGEAEGKALHEDLVKEIKMTFMGDKCISQEPGGERQQTSFKINPGKTPREIDFTVTSDGLQKGKTIKAIYLVKKDSLTICLSMDYGDMRPTKFETKMGSGLMLIVLQKGEEKVEKK